MQRLQVFYPLLATLVYGVGCHFVFTQTEALGGALTWSFIMLIPYALGAIVVYFSAKEKQYSLWYALLMPWVACVVVAGGLAIVSFGVLFCFVIATPILFPAASMGGLTIWIQRRNQKVAKWLLMVALVVPFVGSPVEAQFDSQRKVTVTNTQIVISASAEEVWQNIKTVPMISAEEHHFSWLHWVGLPKPVAATLSHEGVGGVRDATFVGGLRFDETITAWEHLERISFTIEETSEELLPTPLDLIGTEHFDVLAGTYRIEPLGDGTVRLHLSSEHVLATHLNGYGSFWTDYVMRDLQNYILRIVKVRAEGG